MLELLQSSPALLIFTTGLLGLIVGSFLNVVIYRIPQMMQREWKTDCIEFLELEPQEPAAPLSLISPRSSCPACGHKITALENIPVFSYLFLRGQCSSCKTHISLRYPLIEILTACLSALVAWKFGYSLQTVFALYFTWSLIALTFIDIDTMLLPDDLTIPLFGLGLIASVLGLYSHAEDALIGAVAGYGSLWLITALFYLLTRKRGMGEGDFKLFAVFGAWFGWQMLPVIILLSSIAGAFIGISMIIIKGKDKNIPIPFGPYLAIAGWLALMWGSDINHYYMTWLSV